MIPVKVQCACGQKFAFDVEPVDGRMPSHIACPACGADGTAAANEFIAQSLGIQPVDAPLVAPAIAAAPPPLPANLPVTSAVSPAFAPPPAPQVVRASGPPRMPVVQPIMRGPVQKPKSKQGRDGWATAETGFHKLGTYIVMVPPIFAAMLPWGVMGIELPLVATFIVLGVFGIIGGIINVWGRGPIAAGAFIGVTIALGGYGAMAYWLHGKRHVYKYELVIAFAIGAVPGMLLQALLQKLLKKRRQAAAAV